MKILLADGINYGAVEKVIETEEAYLFTAEGKEVAFPKKRYKLNKNENYYDMEFKWM